MHLTVIALVQVRTFNTFGIEFRGKDKENYAGTRSQGVTPDHQVHFSDSEEFINFV